MSETYCGKNCMDCSEKSQLNCPGCRMGPGRVYSGECSIAKCCVTRNVHACEQCTSSTTCFNRRSSEGASGLRLRKQKDEAARQQRLFSNCKLLGNWLMVLFWLVIVTNIAGLILNDDMVTLMPQLKIPAAVFSVLVRVFYGLILLKLTPVSDHYRVSGISMLVCAAILLLNPLIGTSGWSVVMDLIAVVPSFITEFQEYMGHSDATEELDPDMAGKWRNLWYWYFGCQCAIVVGTLLTLIKLFIAALVVFAAAIGVIVIAVMKIIYLYSTAKAFREYSESCSEIA